MGPGDIMPFIAINAAELRVASVRSLPYLIIVSAGFVVFPFGIQMLLHPGDMIRLQAVHLQGVAEPHFATSQQLTVAFAETCFVLAAFVLFQLVCTVLFYRRVRLNGARIARPALWPLATLSIGIVGNILWFVSTGYFDAGGCVIGFCSAVLTLTLESICERLGRGFVFGTSAEFPLPNQMENVR